MPKAQGLRLHSWWPGLRGCWGRAPQRSIVAEEAPIIIIAVAANAAWNRGDTREDARLSQYTSHDFDQTTPCDVRSKSGTFESIRPKVGDKHLEFTATYLSNRTKMIRKTWAEEKDDDEGTMKPYPLGRG
ncbi:hypothetical protein BU24DRAFT_462923 [Aaosphaeria arxii CBS 175.79]|uniref:Uncharacterized protein n=1 Tax=Aaosphaeria arxii CBS 175.79 TaxID=1450172 RepID=A0A6A5XMN8_9PLEO|nr:uncharacterized protein BU24DRAFT_462923 [Aaosphaeria arxii CBS 175.79]KAF2014107.1 hypothetical protein BU24DRAFT_462923 [Aaosphaeria arxii CBS 175.79]